MGLRLRLDEVEVVEAVDEVVDVVDPGVTHCDALGVQVVAELVSRWTGVPTGGSAIVDNRRRFRLKPAGTAGFDRPDYRSFNNNSTTDIEPLAIPGTCAFFTITRPVWGTRVSWSFPFSPSGIVGTIPRA